MTLTEEQIAKIAGLLDCGMTCFCHRPTGVIEYHPDLSHPDCDPQLWRESVVIIESDLENYERLDPMDSIEGFKVMEKFAFMVDDLSFRERILDALSGAKPYRNFKMLLDFSKYRQHWFEYKDSEYIAFVKRHFKALL